MIIHPSIKNTIKLPDDINEKLLCKNTNTILQFINDNKHFEIINNKIYVIDDLHKINTIKLDQLSFDLYDNDKEETFYIPINLSYNKIIRKKYQLHKGSNINLIIENDSKYYFEANVNELSKINKEDIITFLSYLKLYN